VALAIRMEKMVFEKHGNHQHHSCLKSAFLLKAKRLIKVFHHG
jgi:hypothetical protein